MQALQAEALADFLPEKDGMTLARSVAIAVNDDSLATWFLSALSVLHQQHGFLFDLHVDDQDHTLEFLRVGTVLGAVTAEAAPLQGCEVHPLGALRYRAIASPDFAARHFENGIEAVALAKAPMIVFNRKDELQWRFMRRVTRARIRPPVHYMPTSTGFVEAAALGLGWCLAPESLVESALQIRRVVILDPTRWLDVPLYWQHAAVRSSTLQQITRALRDAAEGALIR